MTCVVDGMYADGKGGKVVHNLPISVYDLDNDGKITMMDAFVALHHFQYSDGACGYDEDTSVGTVKRFWGEWLPGSTKYVLNGNTVTKAQTHEIAAGDNIIAYVSNNTNNVEAFFEQETATATAGDRQAFNVKATAGSNVVIPAGADVVVFDSTGAKVDALTTTVYEDGNFAIRFAAAGTYTVVVGGKCTYNNGTKDVEAIVLPARCTVTVAAGNNSGGTVSKPEYSSIEAYISYSREGKIVSAEGTLLYKAPVTVYDYDKDGKYTMAEAFKALHKEYYPGGTNGFSYSADSGWVNKFWGKDGNFSSYVLNNEWVFSSLTEIESGDYLAIYSYYDISGYSDLYTWFDQDEYSAGVNEAETFSVNGLNVMNSSESSAATASPKGATVKVYDSKGKQVSSLATTTNSDGEFTITFPTAGEYTIEVSGKCDYTCDGYNGGGMTYTDAVVVPSRCTVNAYAGGGTGGGSSTTTKEDEKTEQKPTVSTTVTPEVKADKNGEAKAEVKADTIKDAISDAKTDKADEIVIAPKVDGDASKVTVTIPASSANAVAKDANADLKVKTDIADIKISSDDLSKLGASGNLTVSAEKKSDGTVDVTVTANGKNVQLSKGSVTVEKKSASANDVLVIVKADGTEEVIKKSVTDKDGITAVIDGSCTVKVVSKEVDFNDTAKHWANEAAQFVAAREIFNGTGAKTFAPNDKMDRQMVATVLWRLENEVKSGNTSKFNDEVAGWAKDAVVWAAGKQIVNGDENGNFNGNQSVSRQELAAMLYRYAKSVGMDTTTTGSLSKFTDNSKVADWATEAMQWAVGSGLMKGNEDGTINPNGTATRAEVATVVMRLVEKAVR